MTGDITRNFDLAQPFEDDVRRIVREELASQVTLPPGWSIAWAPDRTDEVAAATRWASREVPFTATKANESEPRAFHLSNDPGVDVAATVRRARRLGYRVVVLDD